MGRAEAEIQEYIKRERGFREAIAELQNTHHRQMQEVHFNHEQALTTITKAQQEGSYDIQEVLKTYIQEIDRLNGIVKDLEEEVA